MIIAGMATIPGREESLIKSVESIIDQVDALFLYCNSYTHDRFYAIKKVINNKAKLIRRENNLGDQIKYCGLKNMELLRAKNFTYVTLDDDLTYSPDLIKHLQEGIKRHPGAIVGLHGRVFPSNDIKSYYQSSHAISHCLASSPKDQKVHVLGTGVTMYPPNIGLTWDYFKDKPKNMADIHLAMWAQKNKVPLVAVKHERGIVTYNLKPEQETIYNKHSRRDHVQTELVKSIPKWKFY